MRQMEKILLIATGSLCVGLGVIGIFLPILPTTPFLLLAAYCYARSSERFYFWLITNRVFGEYIRNYHERRGITAFHKIVVLLLLWLTISYTAFGVVSARWVRLLLFGIAAAVTVHILWIKTYRPKQDRSPEWKDSGSHEK